MPVLGFARQSAPSATGADTSPAASSPATSTTEGLIKLDVVVSGEAGEPVAGLESKDFSLLDNGAPQTIVSFHAFDGITVGAEPPVEVILVIDTLNLQLSQISLAKSEAERFCARTTDISPSRCRSTFFPILSLRLCPASRLCQRHLQMETLG